MILHLLIALSVLTLSGYMVYETWQEGEWAFMALSIVLGLWTIITFLSVLEVGPLDPQKPPK